MSATRELSRSQISLWNSRSSVRMISPIFSSLSAWLPLTVILPSR